MKAWLCQLRCWLVQFCDNVLARIYSGVELTDSHPEYIFFISLGFFIGPGAWPVI